MIQEHVNIQSYHEVYRSLVAEILENRVRLAKADPDYLPEPCFGLYRGERLIVFPKGFPYSIYHRLFIIAHEYAHVFQYEALAHENVEVWREMTEDYKTRLFLERNAWVRSIGILRRHGFKSWDGDDWRILIEFALACYATYVDFYTKDTKENRRLKDLMKEEMQEAVDSLPKAVLFV